MKVFQIFSHPIAPVDPYIGYMLRIKEMAERYTLIAPENFMGSDVEFVSIEDLWSEIPGYFRENPNGHSQYDPLRARYLATHFDQVYLDVDVELFIPLEIKDHPQSDGPGVLLGNGDVETGLSCWDRYVELSPSFCRPAPIMFSNQENFRNLDDADKSKYIHHYAKGRYF